MKRLPFSICGFALLLLSTSKISQGQSAGDQPTTQPKSPFEVKFDGGALVSLKSTDDARHTEFIQTTRRLGDVLVRYRQGDGNWQTAQTSTLKPESTTSSADQQKTTTTYILGDAASPVLKIESQFELQPRAIVWTMSFTNLGSQPLEIGDLGVPLPISRGGAGGQRGGGSSGPVILKHSFISGHGSHIYWMPSDSAPPYLVLMPAGDTEFEYWDTQTGEAPAAAQGQRGFGAYTLYVHSVVAGDTAKQRGTNWRQPHTSLALAAHGQANDSKTYGLKLQWADSYDAVRQSLVDSGQIDFDVVPGLTVPTDLSAQFALRTKEPIAAVEAEFPNDTKIESLGTKDDRRLYQVRFSKLGENRLTVHYGQDHHMFLEPFCTEPLETLIKKRAAFLAKSQHRDVSKWYDGLITDWNMDTQKLLSPDNYDPIPRSRVYAVTCDDPGLGKPAFLASKNAEYPVQREVEALDYYIQHFVWGGLQRITDEKYSYGIYGIPDWKTNRDSTDPGYKGQTHLFRVYDYPHIICMYFGMYRVAKNHLEIKTALSAKEYLQRAYGTANAMFTVPHEVSSDWSPYGTGFYNEIVIPDLITELQTAGMTDEVNQLRGFWERKVKSFVNGRRDLFRSEYAFDTTGFESTHAMAKYAMLHVDRDDQTADQPKIGIAPENAKKFLETQLAANLFCRGWLEPAYYLLGSDIRGGGGNSYTLTYMSQMGGWSVLDYGLNFAADPNPYLRLGYASYLSAWALMNTGTPESNYGYWYPGAANDGGAGGGFEPAPYGRTWLGQPHHRGSWYFSSEIDLGYCGALRTAATVLSDDNIFGRICLGGDLKKTEDGTEVIPKDGLRRRFHAMLDSGKLHMTIDTDRFTAAQPIVLRDDLSEVRFSLESDNRAAHIVRLTLSASAPCEYTVRNGQKSIASVKVKDGQESIVDLPIEAAARPAAFTLIKRVQ